MVAPCRLCSAARDGLRIALQRQMGRKMRRTCHRHGPSIMHRGTLCTTPVSPTARSGEAIELMLRTRSSWRRSGQRRRNWCCLSGLGGANAKLPRPLSELGCRPVSSSTGQYPSFGIAPGRVWRARARVRLAAPRAALARRSMSIALGSGGDFRLGYSPSGSSRAHSCAAVMLGGYSSGPLHGSLGRVCKVQQYTARFWELWMMPTLQLESASAYDHFAPAISPRPQ